MAMKACIIGAGPSGITAAKNLIQVGITDFIVFEKSQDVGGNWVYSEQGKHSSVYETTHIISSKTMSAYADFPMPENYADYPSHEELHEYFNDYATAFGVRDYIQFGTSVSAAKLNDEGNWEITLADNSTHEFENLLVCNGHHWDPRMPQYEGTFDGELLHSHQFKNNRGFEDKNVLVIGGGNSACDIAVETGRVSKQTWISMRRGYYFIPKFLLGKPVDVLNEGVGFIPDWIRKIVFKFFLKISVGSYEDYGLQKPDHEFLTSHPVVNSELLYFIRHGKIIPRKDIERIEGKQVHFTDGTSITADVIIAATGYKMTFPFLATSLVDFESNDVRLYKKVIHPSISNLYFIGLVQPMGCIWPLADAHAKLAANRIVGNYEPPSDMERKIDKDMSDIKSKYMNTPRHATEVRFDEHLAELMREIPNDAPEWAK
jgi:cation diffusion facilitator CzcD-associated flavoprotein CzcO